jgi:hypothetical protein
MYSIIGQVVRGSCGIIIRHLISHYKKTCTGTSLGTIGEFPSFPCSLPRIPSPLPSNSKFSFRSPSFGIRNPLTHESQHILFPVFFFGIIYLLLIHNNQVFNYSIVEKIM